MTPQAEPADLPVPREQLVPAERLEDGEVVILAVKPSRWFAILVSWPVVVVGSTLAVLTFATGEYVAAATEWRTVSMFCLAVVSARVVVGCFQWQGRLYVLTDRRVMGFSGVFREEFWQCPLTGIRAVHLTCTLSERMFVVGSLLFELRRDTPVNQSGWMHLSDAGQVRQMVADALRRAK